MSMIACTSFVACASFGVIASASDLRLTPIVRAVRSAGPSVVNIQGQKTVPRTSDPNQSRQVNGMGTGVVIDERGFILTNFHVVDGVRQIKVTLNNGQSTIARIVARDRVTDLAVIKVNVPKELPIISIGTSSDLMVGEPVIALGNAFGYNDTVTRGIISSLHRDVQISDTQQYDDLIQTDAPINPGNSGGPLLNIDGQMIGLNAAVRAGAENIGFAIPIDNAMRIAARLMSVEDIDGNWHGLHVNDGGSDGKPAVVVRIDSGSPAEKIGLHVGDKITRIGSFSTSRALDIERALLGRAAGDSIVLKVRSDAKTKNVRLALAARRTQLASHLKQPKQTNKLDEETWQVLGMRLSEVSREDVEDRNPKYHGGLRIENIRKRSPAASQGIRSGDILIGIHRWRTESAQDIQYIVGYANLDRLSPIEFWVLRDGEPRVLSGRLRLANPAAVSSTAKRR